MPILESANTWAPFRIDALGIITLLGADSLRQTISRLVYNPIVEYLPFLAPQIFADDTIADPVPGFTLYNITDGMVATDLSAWWTRWLLCQKLRYNTTTLDITELNPQLPSFNFCWFLTVFTGVIVNGSLIVMSVLLGDWYGLASSISIIAVVFARSCMLSARRRALDALVNSAGSNNLQDQVKLFLKLPNGKAVTIVTTRNLTTRVLLTEARPRDPFVDMFFRGVIWLGFGVLVVSLGSACLCMQLIIIATLLVPTAVVVNRIGCDEQYVGRRLKITKKDAEGDDSRHIAYQNMNLNNDQKQAFLDWHLFPMKYNTHWWDLNQADLGS